MISGPATSQPVPDPSVPRLADARLTFAGFEISFDEGTVATVSGRWLRDHGDDPLSREPHTGQRLIDTFSLAPDLMPEGLRVTDSGNRLEATWPGEVVSSVAATTLHRAITSTPDTACERASWRLSDEVELWSEPTTPPTDGALVSRLRRDGWALVDGIDRGHEAVNQLVVQLGGVQETIFGTVWELSSEVTDHADSAYDTTFLSPHTDGTYLDDAPRLQVFVCQERDDTGGESTLVDGFAAANDLRATNPDAADLLTSVAVPGRYVEPGVDCQAKRPTFRSDTDDDLIQVSFNNLDRAPFWLPDGRWDRWLDAYISLNAVLNEPTRWRRIGVEPGQALVIDNWRVLHGREAFVGTRRFLGCYVSNETFLAVRPSPQ